jgi:glycosyltransferase involved in cell wall biosynthesis
VPSGRLGFDAGCCPESPLPGTWKILLTPARLLYRFSSGGYSPDVVVCHHETVDSLRVASLARERLGLKGATILQLPPFYGDVARLRRIQRSTRLYWHLVITASKPVSPRDLIYYSHSKLVLPVSTRVAWGSAGKLLGGFNAVLAVSPSIPLEMGGEWAYRVVSFRGVGVDRGELEALLRFREAGAEPRKPHIVFPARLTMSKGLADLLLASALLKRWHPNFKLIITGSGSRMVESQMRRITANPGLKDNVEL